MRETACAIVGKLKAGEVTPLDLLDVLEKRIAEVDGKVNALPTLCFDRARKHATALMKKPAGERGLLAGLPVPIKDLTDVAGVLTTQGSPIYKDNIPAKSDILVEHLEDNGGVIYAKSNTPEFGAGANTFNEVFGATRNPWDTSRSAAGSSGGAAVALATGTAWLAHGSDMGGSLRNPAELLRHRRHAAEHRPRRAYGGGGGRSQSRRPGPDGAQCRGPRAAARRHERRASRPIRCRCRCCRPRFCPPRVPATSRSASPIRPISASRRSIPKSPPSPARRRSALPKPASSSRKRIRTCARRMNVSMCCARSTFALSKAALLRTKRDLLKPEVIWNIEEGLKLTVEQIERAEAQRVAMTARTLEFFDNYDLLLTPTTIVPPFPIENRYVAECAGKKFDNYVEWLGIVYAITLVCCPALSLPCGFTASGLPVGLQVVAAPRGEAQLLAGAKVLEDILGVRGTTPIDPRAPK